MLISQKEKIIFLIPPKTGGTSLHKCLIDSGIEVSTYAYKHLFLSEVVDVFRIKDIIAYKIVQITRNPYTRFCSVYYNQLKVIQKIFLNGLDEMTISEFSKHFLKSLNTDDFIQNFYDDSEFINSLVNPRNSWGGARGLLPQNKWNDLGLNVSFLKLEDISKDVNYLSNHIGLNLINMEVKKANVKNKESYSGILTDDVKKIIKEVYREDFLKLGYD
jgi:hypothetical protein